MSWLLPFTGQCSCDDDGRRVGVCDPANDHRQATVRSGGEDDRTARGVVLWTAVHRLAWRFDMDQIVQEGESRKEIRGIESGIARRRFGDLDQSRLVIFE